MSFVQPIMLFALLGAAVPILIHLIHKRRPRKQRFAAIELVMRSVERVQRRWRLKRFLLLLARVMLLAALAVAAAGPLLGDDQTLAVANSGPQRVAIVVDASLSMRAVYDRTTAFARAILRARNMIDRLGPEDQAVLVAAELKPRALVDRPTGSKQKLLAALDTLEPSFAVGSLGEAVSAAAKALGSLSEGTPAPAEGAPSVTGRVVVLTDMAQPAFEGPADLEVPGVGRAHLELIDVLGEVPPEARTNRAITALDTTSVPGQAPRTVEFRARIQAYAAQSDKDPEPAEITLRTKDEDLFTGSVDLVGGTIVDKVIRQSFDHPGHIPVELTLERDALYEDDVRYALVDVRRQVRTLIVDGSPSGVPKEDEVFYLERALAAGAGDQLPPRVITADDLPRADFTAFDVVILAGVPAFSRSDGARLADFVEKGGGLLISATEEMDTELYNAELSRVLPRPLRALKVVAPERLPSGSSVSSAVGSGGVVSLANPLLEHPIMEIFRGEALSGLLSTQTAAYLLLQPGAQKDMSVLAEYSDGQPALIEHRAGRGRLVLMTSSIDRDLTDLPIRPAFVPLMRQLVLHLGNALAKPDPRRTAIGERREIQVPEGATRIVVRGPDGKETAWEGPELAGPSLAFAGTALPGHYQVEAAFAGPLEPVEGEGFAVNVDTRESDLRPLSVEEAEAVLLGRREGDGEAKATALTRAKALGDVSPEALATILLLVMIGAFVLESILTAQKIGR